jgi:hypothetical protein
MKIGIFTLPLHTNYGGILQAYALQSVLKALGHDVEVIRHSGRQTRRLRPLISTWIPGFVPVRRSNGKFSMLSTRRRLIQNATEDIRSFIGERIQLTSYTYNSGSYDKLNAQGYDAMIVGSDQVWRASYTGIIRSYFLDFIKDRKTIKIAYAPSFGFSDWEFTEEETRDCRQLLSEFNAVSARESIGKKWIKEKLGRDAALVLDPTLLLGVEHYKSLIHKGRALKTACVYVLDPSIQVSKNIDSYLNVRGLARGALLPSFPADHIEEDEAKRTFPSVYDWISAFYYAEFVITDSFHGTVFAIMFNKPFVTLNNSGRGSSRFESLLSELGLLSRLIDKTAALESVVDDLPEIDWRDVNIRLNAWRDRSIAVLNENLASK